MQLYLMLIKFALDNPFPQVNADDTSIQKILSIILAAIASVTVIFIIINALRYSTSLGDPQANARIRDSILYAAIGLGIVLGAEAIVVFVLGRL